VGQGCRANADLALILAGGLVLPGNDSTPFLDKIAARESAACWSR